MRKYADESDVLLKEKLATLRATPERNPDRAAAGRLAFLQASQTISVRAVSDRESWRHSGWKQKIKSIFSIKRKERSPMFTAIATFLTITALIFGGGGVTVAAAQASLPDQPLYGVKLWSEDIRADFTSDPLQQTQLSLKFLDERFEEINSLLNEGLPISETVNAEFQNRIEETIRLASNLPEDQAVQKMLEIKTHLENQQQTLLKLQAKGETGLDAAMLQTRETIQSRLQLFDQSPPDALKQQERTQDQTQDQLQTQDQTQTQDQLQQMIQQATSKPEDAGPMKTPGAGNDNGAQNGANSQGAPVVESTPAPAGNGQGLTSEAILSSTPVLMNNGNSNQNQGGQGQQPDPGGEHDSGGSGSGGKH